MDCPSGKFQPENASAACLPCNPGKFKADAGKTECVDCDENTFSKEPGASSCGNCGVGKTSKNGSAVCQACEAGTFNNEEGKNCKACVSGQYQDQSGQTTCKSKEEGKIIAESKTFQIKVPLGSRICNTIDCEFIACEPGTIGTVPATNVCEDCPVGQSSTQGSTECRTCAKGTFSENKASLCTNCPMNWFQPQDKLASTRCISCPSGWEQNLEGESSCVDLGGIKPDDCDGKLEYLDDSNKDTKPYCRPCPFDGQCPLPGMSHSELSTEPGYWKSSHDNEIYSPCSKGYRGLNAATLAKERCCPLAANTLVSICKDLNSSSHADEQCLTGYVGALCLVCADNYVKMGGKCISCSGGASFATALIPMAIITVILFFIVLLYLYCSTKKTTETLTLENAQRIKKVNKIFGQLKILLSFFQIFSSMPSVLDSVPWPNIVLEFSIPFSIFNMDFLTMISKSSCSVSVRFFDRFLLHMILPLFCLLAVGMAYILSRACKKNLKTRVRLNEETSKVIILIVLLLFPGLTTKIFQVWKCQSIDGIVGELLVQDYSITCHQGEHLTFIFIAAGFLCLYIVGIPLIMFMLMWKNRKHLHDETSSRHAIVKKALGGLYSQCKFLSNVC